MNRPGERSDPEARWVVGASPAAQALEHDLARLAASDVSVLLTGEIGSGKSAAARELHRRSARSQAPLIETQLSALAPTLLEAELFGHVEGAFTGARAARIGRCERAAGGTLVLDGIETLAEALQVKLLRVLQEREFEPVGSSESRPFAARVLATSTRDLESEVRAGRFRADLYYRLAVVTLVLPPLRERGADLVLLTEALLERIAARLGTPLRTLSAAASERLGRHAWPGNLRELENALERVASLAGAAASGPIAASEFDFLDEALQGEPERFAREILAHGVPLAELERALFTEALRAARGNVAAAARALGLSRRAFEWRQARFGSAPENEGGA